MAATENLFAEPEFLVDRVENIDPFRIPDKIKAIASDVDGVLTFYHHWWLNGQVNSWLNDIHDDGRFIFLVTNSYGKRAIQLSSIFKDSPIELIVTPETVSQPGEKATKHRKPHPDMLDFVLENYQLDPEELLMLDDQLSAGILAANRANVPSVLLPRRGRIDHLGVKLIRRGPEAIARAAMGAPFRWRDFPDELTSLEDWRKQHNGLYTPSNKTA